MLSLVAGIIKNRMPLVVEAKGPCTTIRIKVFMGTLLGTTGSFRIWKDLPDGCSNAPEQGSVWERR